jgi:protein phosphatase 1G
MGTYLSTPVTEKGQEEGQSHGDVWIVSWGVVDMQGWRKSMEDSHVARTDVKLNGAAAHVFGVFDGHGGPEVARFTALYLVSVLQQQSGHDGVGPALVQTFHALDRMINDPHSRDELIRLRAIAPGTAEQREALHIPPHPPTVSNVQSSPLPPPAPSEVAARSVTPVGESAGASSSSKEEDSPTAEEDTDSLEPEGSQEASELDQDISSSDEEDEGVDVAIAEIDSTDSTAEEPVAVPVESDNPAALELPQAAAGEVLEQNSSNAAGKVSGMLQRLLKFSGPSGHVVLQVGKSGVITTAPHSNTSHAYSSPNASKPTIVRNGQMMCNLPDHPIHAGATAIVAVITDRTLTVANAGDSRAVLCRSGGVTIALSFDHKPMQITEMSRIRNAGGFVNAFGRVNGNLNLSRSIGDLKYKQVPGLSPAQQMITAEPDILEYVYWFVKQCRMVTCSVVLSHALLALPLSDSHCTTRTNLLFSDATAFGIASPTKWRWNLCGLALPTSRPPRLVSKCSIPSSATTLGPHRGSEVTI